MKVALAQINTVVGDFSGNLRLIARRVREAEKKKVDLIVFPELCLTGYPPRDLVEIPAFVRQNLELLSKVAALSGKGNLPKVDIIVGYVEHFQGNDRKPLRNAAALCQKGKVTASYAKRLLPTYDVFDEGRHFSPGDEVGIFEVRGEKIGISICEDAWNDRHFWEQRIYPIDPIEEEVKQGATLLVNISASPFARGKSLLRRKIFQSLAARHQLPFCYANLVGGNDELIFDGRSFVVDKTGTLVCEGASFKEDLVIVDTTSLVSKTPHSPDPLEEMGEALILGIRDYVHKCGFKRVVLGLSGGIDSSLVAVLAAKALGPKNVLGILMPSPFSSRGSVIDARQLARNLRISCKEIPITSVYQAYRKLLQSKATPDLTDENLQARIRGNILMALSNRYGYLVLSTGNKSEMAVGYCTLYGDMSGGLAVISDLLKTTVYQVARHLNRRGRLIPEAVFTKVPSAELRPHQTDQDSLPPYDLLDPILAALIEELKSEEEIIAMGYDADVVHRVVRLVRQSEYKRRQAAPGFKVTSKAFGMGRRLPIAKKI